MPKQRSVTPERVAALAEAHGVTFRVRSPQWWLFKKGGRQVDYSLQHQKCSVRRSTREPTSGDHVVAIVLALTGNKPPRTVNKLLLIRDIREHRLAV